MEHIKMAFFDIGGTILEFEHREITEKMRDTLHQLQKNGIIICIATGRASVSLPHFSGVDFDAYLTFNGSYCYNKQGAIFDNPNYGFDKSEAMAFGDGDNDIEMLEAVGHGIAMANGLDNVKAIANDMCGDVAQDGIYHYCKMHNLI